MFQKSRWRNKKGNVALFFVLIIGFALLVFLASSGALSRFGIQKMDLTFSDFYKNSSSAKRVNSSSTNSMDSSKNSAKLVPKETPTQLKPTPTSTISPSQIPTGFTLAQLSPYFKKIRIGSVSPGSYNYYGSVYLSTSLSDKDSVNVTGWLLKGKTGSQFIPKAVEVYDPSGLSGESDIILKRNDYLYIYTTASAIGRNLRLNLCTGYLENVSKFTPSLPKNCPRPQRSDVENFSGRCYDYILSLGTCSFPKSNALLPINDYGCRAFLDNLNYKGCFEKHRQDPTFLSHEWRVWMGSKFLDTRHDHVYLFDNNGLLVDERSY